MSGVTTLLMVTVGVRLPLFQGPVAAYIIPMLALKMIDKNICIAKEGVLTSNTSMERANMTSTAQRELSEVKLREGSLIVTGIIHCLIGATGAVGFFLRYIGPVTLVPTILLSCVYIGMASAKFAGCHWGVSMFGILILSLYLGHKNMPIPFLSREKGLHIVWMPFHQMCSILIGMLAGWGLSAVLTYTGMLTDNKDHYSYQARTDAQPNIVSDANWFNFPNKKCHISDKFGTPLFNTGVFVAFLIATVISILDSVGDYYACARVCNLPPPPRNAINRGIAIEGLCTAISGAVGCGHATTTFGENIGTIGLTKVASRDLFVGLALVYMLFGVVSKVSAVFLSIPYPVLGGSIIVLYGMFNGIILSNLKFISLSSTRNISIIGTSLLLGLMVPKWIEDEPDGISTGDSYYDNIIRTLLVNPNLCGGVLAFFLDNTVPGKFTFQ
ncbi:Solute carrier family 23 member 1 [Mizuhopecten yessoensis]|uniref:Solute carrier family 23 member 1 n=1 Tax=Mizuhopecten yessoensis TaxID=6573 RepID=A0A210PP09_MIZYE|nr:Solute carrier family 23 member 1 [Mizuhopecten yessoensis]